MYSQAAAAYASQNYGAAFSPTDPSSFYSPLVVRFGLFYWLRASVSSKQNTGLLVELCYRATSPLCWNTRVVDVKHDVIKFITIFQHGRDVAKQHPLASGCFCFHDTLMHGAYWNLFSKMVHSITLPYIVKSKWCPWTRFENNSWTNMFESI